MSYKAIGAHIYAGGFTVGVAKYFDVACHLEHAAYGKEIVELNLPGVAVHAGGPAGWPTKWPRGTGGVRFVYANPPCAIWSGASAGRKCSWRDDPRLQMHRDIFALLETVNPDVMAIESVTAAFTKGREHVDDLIAKAAAQGYAFTAVLHDAQHLGVPQVRKRVFLVFHRVAIDWEMPKFGPPITVAQAFSRLKLRKPIYSMGIDELMHPRWAECARAAKPGEKFATVFNRLHPDPEIDTRGRVVGRPGFIYSRAPLDRPCGVVMAGSLFHPVEDRALHQDELATLCGFPRDWKWPEGLKYSDVSGYMSRGVMPPVGAWLARNAARAIDANKRLNRPESKVLNITKAPGSLTELI